jgi:hypothetical protein
MKFLFSNKRLQVSFLMCFFISSCNKEEFFEMISTVEGRDSYCSMAIDLNTCESRSDVCQPSFEDSADENATPLFAACIANPIIDPAPTTPGDGSTPTTPGDGSTPTTPGDGSTPTTPGDGSTPTTPGDGSTPTTPGDSSTPTTPGDGSTPTTPVVVPPTIEETIEAKCTNLGPDYLWIKSSTQKNKVVSRVVKVKVCHRTGNLSTHTILIACPALISHVEHHEDYIGACKL